jgi:hypothetical protein
MPSPLITRASPSIGKALVASGEGVAADMKGSPADVMAFPPGGEGVAARSVCFAAAGQGLAAVKTRSFPPIFGAYRLIVRTWPLTVRVLPLVRGGSDRDYGA